MNCKRARALIHELLDGALADRSELDAHLADCSACRSVLGDLARLDGALRTSLTCPLDEARLARLTESALVSAERGRPSVGATSWLLPARLAAAAALLLVFAAGLLAGRTLWPRETVTTRTVYVPRVVEKTVERTVKVPVQVPVVREVRVVRTRTVYRDRIVEVARPAPTEPTIILAQTPPVKADEIVVRLPAASFTSPTVSTELHPARIVEPEPSTDQPDLPRQGTREGPSGQRIAQVPTAAALSVPR